MSTGDLFDNTPHAKTRRNRRVMMHVVDAGLFPDGEKCIQFECATCGHNTGHIYDRRTVSQNRRGMACPVCNPAVRRALRVGCNALLNEI